MAWDERDKRDAWLIFIAVFLSTAASKIIQPIELGDDPFFTAWEIVKSIGGAAFLLFLVVFSWIVLKDIFSKK